MSGLPGRTDRRRSCMMATTACLRSTSSSVKPWSRTTASSTALTALICSAWGGWISVSIACSCLSCRQTQGIKKKKIACTRACFLRKQRWGSNRSFSPGPSSCAVCPWCVCRHERWTPAEHHRGHRCKEQQGCFVISAASFKKERKVQNWRLYWHWDF